MSLISFIKDAGEKLFGHHDDAATTATPTDGTPATVDVATANANAAAAILTYIQTQNLQAQDLNIEYDGASGVATVSGIAEDQATKEKILLAAGNVHGVSHVQDNLSVTTPSPASGLYTVQKGDTLSSIAKSQLGNANDYNEIFEANRPLLTSPDKIYPGQVLRIPEKQ